MRKSSFFFLFIAICLCFYGLAFTHALFKKKANLNHLQAKTNMVKRFALSDLCLFTEASYIRHLSQADLHTPFQDGPITLEHFPSGSLVAPPSFTRNIHEKGD
jgi:hypothetical protein